MVLAVTMLVSLFAVVSTATGVSGTVMTGTGPAATNGAGGICGLGCRGHEWSRLVELRGERERLEFHRRGRDVIACGDHTEFWKWCD